MQIRLWPRTLLRLGDWATQNRSTLAAVAWGNGATSCLMAPDTTPHYHDNRGPAADGSTYSVSPRDLLDITRRERPWERSNDSEVNR